MKNKTGAILGNLFAIGCLILIAAFIGGCATTAVKPTPPPPVMPPPVEAPPVTVPKVDARMFPDFVAIIVQEKDSLSSLASKYLNDPSMDWLIAEFNGISTLSPGQAIIIPLKP